MSNPPAKFGKRKTENQLIFDVAGIASGWDCGKTFAPRQLECQRRRAEYHRHRIAIDPEYAEIVRGSRKVEIS